MVLKIIAARKEIGWRLTDLAAHCQLDTATTYRIVACLVADRLVQQRSSDRRYVPGPLLWELSLALPAYTSFVSALRPELVRIARRLSGISFLYLRSGAESVCVERAGSARVQPMTMVGTRRPMAESTAGIAMMLRLPLEEQQELIAFARNQKHRTTEYRASAYRTILQRSRRYGFGVNRGDTAPGLNGVNVPVMDGKNRPFASIGLMGPAAMFAGERLAKLATALHEDAERISREYSALIHDLDSHER